VTLSFDIVGILNFKLGTFGVRTVPFNRTLALTSFIFNHKETITKGKTN